MFYSSDSMFRRLLTLAWSAAAADVNHDGILDIIAGPFYYLGPDYRVSREIYPSQTSTVGTQYTPAAVSFAYDYTGDGWPDYLVSTGRAMVLYVNPKGELRRWDKYNVLPTINSEVAVFKDIDGDGKPDVATANFFSETVSELLNVAGVGNGVLDAEDESVVTDQTGEIIPIDVKVGDTVVYSKYGGTEITVDGEDLLILTSRDVLAKVAK